MVLISTNYRNIVLVTHQFDAAIKVMIFENSLPLPERRFYRICCVGKDLIIIRLRPCRFAPACRRQVFGKLDACRIWVVYEDFYLAIYSTFYRFIKINMLNDVIQDTKLYMPLFFIL